MKKNLTDKLIIAITIILLQSCHFNIGTTGIWKNDNIDPDVKNEINKLNQKLFEAFKTNNVTAVKQLMSQSLLNEAGTKIDTLVNSINSAITVPGFKVFDQFYVKNTSDNVNTHLFSGYGNSNDYEIDYLAVNKESYTCLLVPATASSNGIILVSYGKYDEGWEINLLYIGARTLFDKTAPDYYKEARNEYDKGNIINAVDLMSVAKELANPLSTFFKYEDEDQMKAFYTKVVTEGNKQYQFSITVNAIGPGVQIFGVSPQVISNGSPTGIIPIIRYKTSIQLKDTVALKAENIKLQKVIENVFKGITTNNRAIIYQAYDTIPDGKTLVKRYGFIQRM